MAVIKICISLVAHSLICLCACVLCFLVFILYTYLFFSIEAPRNGCSHCIGPKKKTGDIANDRYPYLYFFGCLLVNLLVCLFARPPFPIAMVGDEAFNDIPVGLIANSMWSDFRFSFFGCRGCNNIICWCNHVFFVFLTRFLFRIYKILGILQSQQAIILIIFPTNF